jgi:glycine cleavage system aminomethyltransferase T
LTPRALDAHPCLSPEPLRGCAPCCRYVDKAYAKAGTPLKLLVRGKQNDATVTKMPFVPTHYYKPS